MTESDLLLVEDNAGDARLIEEILRDAPYSIRHVASMKEALQAIATVPPDLVLLDLTLPDSMGVRTLSALRKKLNEIPIVVLSGMVDEATAQEAVARGAQDYLVKGEISEAGLLRVLRYAAERSRLAAERVHLERSLSQSRKLEAVGQLAAGIAHEINTPTQYVSDNTRFIQDSLADVLLALGKLKQAAASDEPVDSGHLRAILEEADVEYLLGELPGALDQSLDGLANIARIVKAMKEFSHPASAEMSPANLNEALSTTSVVASNEWKYVADLEQDLDPAMPPVMCLPGEINQVFLNLIVNASHAIADNVGDGADKGRIGLQTRVLGDGWISITISDTGCGIAEEHRQRVFDPFFTTKDVGRGTGQGLAIAYDVIVNKHGGSIEMDSEVGKGTSFIIRLPIEPQVEPTTST